MKPSWKKCLKISLVFLLVHLALIQTAHAEEEDPRVPPEAAAAGRSTFVGRAPLEQHRLQQQQQQPSPSLSSGPRLLKRRKRAGFDGFRFSDLTRIFNTGAMEGVDSLLRSTRNLDVFQCLERISCEMAAPLRDAGSSLSDPGVAGNGVVLDEGGQVGNQAAQATQGLQQAGQFLQPGLQQFAQFPQFVQPGYPYIPQPGFQHLIPQVAQTGFPTYIQPTSPFVPTPGQFIQYPQYVPTIPQLVQPGVQGHQAVQPAGQTSGGGQHTMQASASTTSQAAHHRMFPVAHQGSHPTMHHAGAPVRRSDNSHGTQHVQYEAPTYRWQEQPNYSDNRNQINQRPKKRNWFRTMFENLYGRNRRTRRSANILRRHKRGIMDTLRNLWSGRDVVGVLDRMMEGTDDSIYPYTRAALMGYTGTSETCEQLYPECPTTVDEMLNTFNNLRSYFPNGVPFRDRIPAPLRYLVP